MKSFAINNKASRMLILFLALASILFLGCNKTPEKPKLTLTADTLVFKGNETHSLFLTTNDPERHEFYVDYPYPWISVSPSNGYITEGETIELKLNSFLDDTYTIQEDLLYVSSNYDQKTVTLIGLPEGSNMHFVPDTLRFPLDVDSIIMRLSNFDTTAMNYSITASNGFVRFSPASGQVPKMYHADITVSVDRASLLSEPNPKLYVTIDNEVDSVLIIPERKLRLPNEVVDAEYAKATNLLVYVSADSKLNIYHPDNRTVSSVNLPYVPTCVSVSPDGTKAAVGHNTHVTYVDLLAETMLTDNEVSCDVFDIVLTDNGWAYMFPRRDQWEYIRCMNISINNALEIYHTGNHIYAGTKAKLHPSGKFIYGADNGSSSTDMEKYDIQDGIAHYLYQTPPYSYNIDGDLWFEESGEKVFTRGGAVLKTNEVQSTDMVGVGEITLEGPIKRIQWLDQLDLKNEFYLVIQKSNYSWNYDPKPNPPYVYVYNSDDLTYKTKIKLESFTMATEYGYIDYAAEPYFVFANSNGEELYVITKATGSEMTQKWAIQTIYLE